MIDCRRNFETCMVMMSDVDIEPILDRYMLLTDEYVVVLMLNGTGYLNLTVLFHLLTSFFIFVVPLYCF